MAETFHQFSSSPHTEPGFCQTHNTEQAQRQFDGCFKVHHFTQSPCGFQVDVSGSGSGPTLKHLVSSFG